jgi:TRAP transporter TAXI family solute receptor
MSDDRKRWLAGALRVVVGAAFGLWTSHPWAITFNITTAAQRGTYIQIGKALAQFVAKPAGIEMGVLPSAGSIENVKRLRYDPGVKLAIVQQDVYQAFLDIAPIDRTAADIIRPLRVILPLYDEEIYFLVGANSPLNFVHEIKGQTINSGPLGSGTSLSVSTLYRAMFGEEPTTSSLSNEDALVKLMSDGRGVVAIVGGQPTALLTNMKAEVRQYLKILRVDPDNPATKAALKTYSLSNVRQISYPNLLSADQWTFSVKALLVTYDFNYGGRQRPSATTLVKFAKSLCDNFPVLQDSGHSKWRDVKIAFPDLGAGWKYYPPTTAELRKCATPSPSEPPPPPASPDACTAEKRILGLC